MFPPLPTKPIVTNDNGERVINPMLRMIKGITLQPKLSQATVTVPAATGAQPGTTPAIVFESPFAGYTEIFSFLGDNVDARVSSPNYDVFCNVSCTRYGGRYFTSRPTPFPFIFGYSTDAVKSLYDSAYQINPSLHEISVAPIIAPQQTVSVEMFNIGVFSNESTMVLDGRLIESGVNIASKGALMREYNDRGRIMPFWLSPDQNIKTGGISTGMPGLTFTAGGDRIQTAMFVNKFPNTFIATAMMVFTSDATKFNIKMYNKAYHELSNNPIPMQHVKSSMSQPYLFANPIVMNRGDDFRMDVTVADGIAVPSANIYVVLFGMSLI